MAEAKRESEMYPRDLLRRFGSGNFSGESSVTVKEESMEEIELSLGLSLGGTFGVDPNKNGLVRSSSIAAFSFFPKKEDEMEHKEALVAAHMLMRTCSLPVETNEEQRKRKEMQSLRRLEAKRKREEKRGLKPKAEEICAEEGKVLPNSAQFQAMNEAASSTSSSLAQKRRQEHHIHQAGSAAVTGRLISQRSAGAQGGCSTSSSDYDCQPMRGLDISGLAVTNDIQPVIKNGDHNAQVLVAPCIVGKTPSKKNSSSPTSNKPVLGENGAGEMARSMMEGMPWVSTKADGPNGRRVEGFLYKYTKGEDVRIMCVCHGSFLSPAEFVKHGGGGDVEFPLRHIVVYPSPQTFL